MVFRKRLFYYRLAAASVLILLAFGAGYFFALYQNQSVPASQAEAIPEQIIEENETTPEALTELDETAIESTPSTGVEENQIVATDRDQKTVPPDNYQVLAAAVSAFPPIMAPAWPILLPFGAVCPAINPTTGFVPWSRIQ